MASTDSKIEKLLAGNRKVAETWSAPPTMEQFAPLAAENGGATILRTFTFLRFYLSCFVPLHVHAD